MSNLFGSKPKAAAPTVLTQAAPDPVEVAAEAAAANTPPPTISSPAVQEPAQNYMASLAQAFGRASTMLTGGQGDTSAAPVQRKTLLGGP